MGQLHGQFGVVENLRRQPGDLRVGGRRRGKRLAAGVALRELGAARLGFGIGRGLGWGDFGALQGDGRCEERRRGPDRAKKVGKGSHGLN